MSPDPTATDEEGIGRRALGWLWDNKEWLARKFTELRNWLKGPKKGQRGILILGPGGVGKTTAATLLAGDARPWYESLGTYDESLLIERYSLKDDPEVEIVVPPGQRQRREATWDDLLRDIGAGQFRGIIVVSAFGYHSLGEIRYKTHPLYQGDKNKFVERYLKDRRAEEMAVLRRLLQHAGLSPEKLWILTLVTKQDLWWKQVPEVEQYYRSGVYGAEIRKVAQQRGRSRFHHELVLASLVISNFTTGLDENPLKKNAEGYDHALQVKSLRRLFEAMDALRNWEAGS